MGIPRYQQQVEPALTPLTQAQPAADAGVAAKTLGGGLEQLGHVAASIGADVFERGVNADNARAMGGFGVEAGSIYAKQKALIGTDALKGTEPAKAELEKARKRWSEGLATDVARGLFERQSGVLAGGYNLRMEEHFLAQTRVAEEADAGAAMKSAVNQAALHYDNPGMLETLYTQAGASAIKLGRTPAEAAAAAAAVKQDVLAEAIRGALTAEKPDQAKALFYANRDALGAKGLALEAAINEAGNARLGLSEGDRIAALAVKNGQVDTNVIDAEATKIADPAVRKIAEQTALEHAKLRADGFNATVDNLYAGLMRSWDTKHSRAAMDSTAVTQLQSMGKPGIDAWNHIEAKIKSDIKDWQEDGPVAKAKQRAWDALGVAMADHPERFSTMTSDNFERVVIPELPRNKRDAARAKLSELHENANKAVPLGPQDEALILGAGRNAGVFPDTGKDVSTWDPGQQATWAAARDEVQARAARYKQDNGKSPPLEEKQKWIDSLLLKGHVKGTAGFWDKGTPLTPLQARMTGQTFEPSWSPAQISEAEAALVRNGKPASQRNVDLFLAQKYGLPTEAPAAESPPEELVSPIRRGSL